jgi:predicted Zn-dependent protease
MRPGEPKRPRRRSREATALGASYADVRINRYRRKSIATRERQVQNVSRSASYGLRLRVHGGSLSVRLSPRVWSPLASHEQ